MNCPEQKIENPKYLSCYFFSGIMDVPGSRKYIPSFGMDETVLMQCEA
jgi:hypothetical protein